MTWREIVESHHSSLVDELSKRLDSDLRHAVAEAVASERSQAGGQLLLACDQARRAQAEGLNQSLRRLRHAGGEEHILQTLQETCAPYAEQTVVLVFENNQARVAGAESTISFDIVSAPAVVAAIDSHDPVVALATEAELSPDLARKFRAPGDQPDRHAYLFPLLARHSVVAMLIASGSTALFSAPIELLCEAAAMRLETLQTIPESTSSVPAPAPHSGLVQVTPSPGPAPNSTPTASERLTWDALSPDNQKLHLRAQRMARLRVAEMRLYHEAELREGIASSNIYSVLKSDIDTARNQFLQEFLAKSPTMVDYLHLEILRSLAHDDDRLLGHNYPGPMV